MLKPTASCEGRVMTLTERLIVHSRGHDDRFRFDAVPLLDGKDGQAQP